MEATATIPIMPVEAMETGPNNHSREISTEIREETVEAETVLLSLTETIIR
jgi:hypothetical protein